MRLELQVVYCSVFFLILLCVVWYVWNCLTSVQTSDIQQHCFQHCSTVLFATTEILDLQGSCFNSPVLPVIFISILWFLLYEIAEEVRHSA
jgi:hypothetical protein